MSIFCLIFGHDERYIGEYPNEDGYLQADAECIRCGHTRVAWVGCHVSESPDWDTVVADVGGDGQ